MAGGNRRVGIDEKQNVAASGARAGVVDRGYPAEMNRHDDGAGSFGSLRRGVRRSVIDDDDFKRFRPGLRRVTNSGEGARQFVLLCYKREQ